MGITTRHVAARHAAPRGALQSKWLLLGAMAVAMATLAMAPRPLTTSAPSGDATTTQALRLQVDAAGYRLDGKPVTRDGLEQALRTARGEAPALRLRIDASDSDPQQLIGALALADQAGIRNVGSRVQ